MSTDLQYPKILQGLANQVNTRKVLLEQFISSVYENDDSVTFLYKHENSTLPSAWTGPAVSGNSVATYNSAVTLYLQVYQRFCLVFGFTQ
jgi:hypothetical protein